MYLIQFLKSPSSTRYSVKVSFAILLLHIVDVTAKLFFCRYCDANNFEVG